MRESWKEPEDNNEILAVEHDKRDALSDSMNEADDDGTANKCEEFKSFVNAKRSRSVKSSSAAALKEPDDNIGSNDALWLWFFQDNYSIPPNEI